MTAALYDLDTDYSKKTPKSNLMQKFIVAPVSMLTRDNSLAESLMDAFIKNGAI